MTNKNEMSENEMQALLNSVLAQILSDLNEEDVTAIEELLRFCPVENLKAYLSDKHI